LFSVNIFRIFTVLTNRQYRHNLIFNQQITIMKKQNDLTPYGKRELYNWFQNDAGLYDIYVDGIQRNHFNAIHEIAKVYFLFRPDQLKALQSEFNAAIDGYDTGNGNIPAPTIPDLMQLLKALRTEFNAEIQEHDKGN